MSVRSVIGISDEIAARARLCGSVVDVVRTSYNAGRNHQRIDNDLTRRDREGVLHGTLSLHEHRARLTTEAEELIRALVQRLQELS